MRLGLMTGYSGSKIHLPMPLIHHAERLGFYAVWTAEAYGSDAVTPLAWIGEQMMSFACSLQQGFTLNFPEEPETVQQNIREIGPRVMFSPPRIWENMVSRVQVKIEDSSWLKKKIVETLRDKGLLYTVPRKIYRLYRRLRYGEIR